MLESLLTICNSYKMGKWEGNIQRRGRKPAQVGQEFECILSQTATSSLQYIALLQFTVIVLISVGDFLSALFKQKYSSSVVDKIHVIRWKARSPPTS